MKQRSGPPSDRWRAGSAGMGAVFSSFALLQYNDPDPWIWALAYLVPALVSFARAAGQSVRPQAVAMAVLYVIWALTWRPIPGPELMALEYEKEVAGLLIAAFWMAVLAVSNKSKSA